MKILINQCKEKGTVYAKNTKKVTENLLLGKYQGKKAVQQIYVTK